MSLTLWKSPRLKFQIGREAHANVGSCVSAYSCDHGSHGRLWCACFSSKGALCVRCMAEIGPCRELPPSPDAPGGGLRCTARTILPPCPNKRPGVGRCGGEREGNIERVRQWRCCAFRSPPYPERSLPRGRPHRNQGHVALAVVSRICPTFSVLVDGALSCMPRALMVSDPCCTF